MELWRASGRSAANVAAELGIRPPLLYRWGRAERVPNTPKGEKPLYGIRMHSALAYLSAIGFDSKLNQLSQNTVREIEAQDVNADSVVSHPQPDIQKCEKS